jgi:Cu(I)/Ag(I) efflux system membrane protein CusA/SilA
MAKTASTAELLPIMWSAGTGSGVMKRVAAPTVGKFFTSLLELTVYPVIYYLWKGRSLQKGEVRA